MPAHTLTDRTIPVSDVFAPMAIEGTSGADRRDGGGDAGARARGRPARRRDRRAVRGDAATGPRRVEELCSHAGYSKRTLQRLFREYVGVTPKWVLQRVRLHEAADRMADGEQDWPRLALELGYFDQAHFIKAFKAVIGLSPASTTG